MNDDFDMIGMSDYNNEIIKEHTDDEENKIFEEQKKEEEQKELAEKKRIFEEQTKELKEEAAKGDLPSMIKLYEMYKHYAYTLTSLEGKSDVYMEGLQWLEKAAEAGSEEAQYQLSIHYRGGGILDDTEDDALAEEWLVRAADSGYQPARDELWEIYENNQ